MYAARPSLPKSFVCVELKFGLGRHFDENAHCFDRISRTPYTDGDFWCRSAEFAFTSTAWDTAFSAGVTPPAGTYVTHVSAYYEGREGPVTIGKNRSGTWLNRTGFLKP